MKTDSHIAPKRIGVVLKGYPRLSETFIAQEIAELEALGFALDIISLRHPTDRETHKVHEEITAPVHYLPEYLHDEPLRVFRAWRWSRGKPGYREAVKAFRRDFRRDRTRNRIRRFGQGLVLAAEYGENVDFLYAHFIHTPASVARYAAMICRVPFAISAHAKDIWTTPQWDIREKLEACAWCVTCTRAGLAALGGMGGDIRKLHLVYHGVDLDRFASAPRRSANDGSVPGNPLQFLTVGRAVAKKGLDTVISALAHLPPSLFWRWTHIGGGPLRDELVEQARKAGIAEQCRFAGAKPQAEVLAAYREADLFILPCRVDATGDRDGLPNVIVEAMSQSLAVLTTPVSGAPEAVADGETGAFVPPDEPAALAVEILRLSQDNDLRVTMGEKGANLVKEQFSHHSAIKPLTALLEASLVVGDTVE